MAAERTSDRKGFTTVEIMVVIAIIGVLAAIATSNFIAYRNKAFCSRAESDAKSIAASISDYFSIGSHTSISDASYKIYPQRFRPNSNSFTISAADPSISITITVTDVSARCPTDYINSNPVVQGDGWIGSVYQKVISR